MSGSVLLGASWLGLSIGHAAGQPVDGGSDQQPQVAQLAEIVVTAEKRKESADTVPMSLVAVSGEQLQALGISSVRDLAAIAPSFSYADSQWGTPVYTLRGVGFNDTSMGGRPTVSIYLDQAPIPFSCETLGAQVDLERVEVLEGPQGTLFGQNSTGGAINYIAAKPTKYLAAGADLSYGNYSTSRVDGYVSGPLGASLTSRLAIEYDNRGNWQQSYTSGAKLGSGDFIAGRWLLAWEPASAFTIQSSVNGYRDGRDTQAPQLIAVTPNVPTVLAYIPGLANYPIAPPNDRAADWDPALNFHKHNDFIQANLRADYTLPLSLVLTSLSSYSNYHQDQPFQFLGTDLPAGGDYKGHINSIFQELRISGNFLSRGNFIVGANYERDRVNQHDYNDLVGETISYSFVPLGLPVFTNFKENNYQKSSSYAAYININYHVADHVRVYGGARYTRMDEDLTACSADSGDGNAVSVFAPFYDFIRGQLGLGPNPPSAPGACLTATPSYAPMEAQYALDQNNVSWRGGVDWTPAERTLLYAAISRGYKAGGFPDLGATAVLQYRPASQESVTDYEVGFKSVLPSGTVRLTGATFYYDYKDKQVLGYYTDPVFGPINRLVNVPKSSIKGAELSVDWLALRGLRLKASGSYIDSKILDSFTATNENGVSQDFGGESFPNTPRWQVVGGAQYEASVSSGLTAFAELNIRYSSETNSQLGDLPLTRVIPYTLVDLTAGMQSSDGAWRLAVWGHNITNRYYWTASYRNSDTVVRYAGMPATYGITLSYRFNAER